MKTNTVLFLVLCGLLSFTYVFQELRDRESLINEKYDNGLFDARKLGELKEFKTIYSHVVTKNDEYFLKESAQSVDPRKVQSFFDALSGIKIKRILTKEEIEKRNISTYFTTKGSELEKMSFIFQETEVHFYLGRKLEFDQAFYMKVEKNNDVTYVIAHDTKPLNVPVAKKDFHRNDLKFRRFQSLFYFNDDAFLDFRLFHPWMKKKWSLKKIVIDSVRNPEFSLILQKGTTNPKPPKFLSMNLEYLQEYEKRLVNLEALKRVGRLNQDYEMLGEIKVTNVDNNECLYKVYKRANDYYIYSSLLNDTYQIRSEDSILFLGHLQLFWSLRLVNLSDMALLKPANEKAFALKKGKLLEVLSKPANSLILFERNLINSKVTLKVGEHEFFLQSGTEKIYVIHKKSLQTLVYDLKDATLMSLIKSSKGEMAK